MVKYIIEKRSDLHLKTNRDKLLYLSLSYFFSYITDLRIFSDNVHFFSSAQLVKALTDAEVQFRFQVK